MEKLVPAGDIARQMRSRTHAIPALPPLLTSGAGRTSPSRGGIRTGTSEVTAAGSPALTLATRPTLNQYPDRTTRSGQASLLQIPRHESKLFGWTLKAAYSKMEALNEGV
jgi:hypothetical protein